MPAHDGFGSVKTGMLVFLHGFGIFKNVVHMFFSLLVG